MTKPENRKIRSRKKLDTPILKSRPIQYIENVAKGMTQKEAALKAGYSESTAIQSTRIGTKKALQKLTEEDKQTLGISYNELKDRVRFIALEQHKDYSSATKLLTAIGRNMGVNLKTEDDTKISVPILNIVVEETSQKTQPIEIKATDVSIIDNSADNEQLDPKE